MTAAQRLEAFLALLYADAAARAAFLADPRGEARRAGLAPGDVEAVAAIDRAGLELTATSVARKGGRRRRLWR